MELPGNEFMTPTSHGPPVSSTLRGRMATANNRHVCERLHGVLTAKGSLFLLRVRAAGNSSTGSTYLRFRRDAPIMATSLAAITTSTATNPRARRPFGPSTIANVSGTAREKSRRTICDFFQKTESTWNGETDVRISTRCPLYPQKRTFVAATGMSALCQKQTLINGAP
jgi:hypothetical protein